MPGGEQIHDSSQVIGGSFPFTYSAVSQRKVCAQVRLRETSFGVSVGEARPSLTWSGLVSLLYRGLSGSDNLH